MASKLAGQRMLLTKWAKAYDGSDDDAVRARACRQIARVLAWARTQGMTPEQIAEGRSLPAEAVRIVERGDAPADDADPLEVARAEAEIVASVDASAAMRLGTGRGVVYAYGYSCAPDRLKIGRTDGDALNRISAQINASTPDRPRLLLEIRTDFPGHLERALHGALTLRGLVVPGGGSEWFVTTADEILGIYRALLGEDYAHAATSLPTHA